MRWTRLPETIIAKLFRGYTPDPHYRGNEGRMWGWSMGEERRKGTRTGWEGGRKRHGGEGTGEVRDQQHGEKKKLSDFNGGRSVYAKWTWETFSPQKMGKDKLRKAGGCLSLQRETLRTAYSSHILCIAYLAYAMINKCVQTSKLKNINKFRVSLELTSRKQERSRGGLTSPTTSRGWDAPTGGVCFIASGDRRPCTEDHARLTCWTLYWLANTYT